MRFAELIVLMTKQKNELTKLSRSNTTSVRLARRAKIILLASSGYDNLQIAEELGVGRVQVGRWRERYARDGLAGIEQDLDVRAVRRARIVLLAADGRGNRA